MKKLTVTILLFAIFLGAATAYISAEVNSGKDKVSFEETVLFGDKIYANGVTFTMETTYARKLNWKTDYTIGFTPECNTEYRFSAEGIPEANSGIDILSDVSHLDFIQDKYREAVNTAKKENKSVTYKIKLKDHIDYFPITVDVDLPDVILTEENRKRLNKKVNEFFKIPVPNDCEVTISADSGGETSSVWRDCEEIDFYLHGMLYTQDTVFLSSFNDDDNRIYSINYGKNEVYEDTLKIAYEAGANFEIDEVNITDKTLVILGTDTENNKTLLRVLDLKTMECIQNLQVSGENSDSTDATALVRDDFLKIEIYDYNSKANENDDEVAMHFYQGLPDGTYEYSMSIHDKEKMLLKNNYFTAVDFDGQRAVFAQAVNPYIAGGASFYRITVSVYDENGLLYIGEYDCSLVNHDKGDYYMLGDTDDSIDINIG